MLTKKEISIGVALVSFTFGVTLWQKNNDEQTQNITDDSIAIHEEIEDSTQPKEKPTNDFNRQKLENNSKEEKKIVQLNTPKMDDIGGYIDESAIAPEDEVSQNKNLHSIGFYDPNSKAPESENIPSLNSDMPMIIEQNNQISRNEKDNDKMK